MRRNAIERSRNALRERWSNLTEAGRAGQCVLCRRSIERSRLEAAPWVATCFDCASKLELPRTLPAEPVAGHGNETIEPLEEPRILAPVELDVMVTALPHATPAATATATEEELEDPVHLACRALEEETEAIPPEPERSMTPSELIYEPDVLLPDRIEQLARDSSTDSIEDACAG